MQQPQEMDPRAKILARLSAFLTRSRIILLAVGVAAAAFFIGYFVWNSVSRSTAERSALLAEEAQEQFDQWSAMESGDKKTQAEAPLLEKLNLIIRRYPHQYATQRALFVRAHFYAQKQDWKEAAEDFQDLARSFPNSYLAVISLFDAGVALEQLNRIDDAIAAYKQLTEKYPKSYLVPHALFSLGRLHEAKGDYAQASAAYNRLADEYPASNWTKAGRNRIIDLQVQGKIAIQ